MSLLIDLTDIDLNWEAVQASIREVVQKCLWYKKMERLMEISGIFVLIENTEKIGSPLSLSMWQLYSL